MTKAKFTKILKERLKIEQIEHQEFLDIMETLIPLEGKPFNKHFSNKLPDHLKLERDTNGYYIKTLERRHFLAYFSESDAYDPKIFAERNAPYNRGARERAEKLEFILKDPIAFKRHFDQYKRIEKIVKLFQECKMMNSSSYNNPAHYYLKKEILKPIRYERERVQLSSML